MQHSQFKNQKSATKCTPLHQNAAYFKTAEKEPRVSQRHPKPNHHNTALAKAVQADHSQYPKGTRFPIQKRVDSAMQRQPSESYWGENSHAG